ncbi:HNH endonuclease, partial [Amycolatopsis sp. WAC 01375]
MALLGKLADRSALESVNASIGLLDDNDSVAVARAASVGIARLEAVRFRALARLNRHREGARGVTQEVAFALSLVDNHAGAMVAAAEALTARLPRTLTLMDEGKVSGFGAMKVA